MYEKESFSEGIVWTIFNTIFNLGENLIEILDDRLLYKMWKVIINLFKMYAKLYENVILLCKFLC